MKRICLNCTEYIKELVTAGKLDEECLMYVQYIITLSDDENGEIEIYRVQTGINKDYDDEDGTTIVEYRRLYLTTILKEQALHIYADNINNIVDLADPKQMYNMSLRNIIQLIIDYDESHGFESRTITEYKKCVYFSEVLKDLQSDSPMLIF